FPSVKNVPPPGMIVMTTAPGPGADSCAYADPVPINPTTASIAAIQRVITHLLRDLRQSERHLNRIGLELRISQPATDLRSWHRRSERQRSVVSFALWRPVLCA